MLEDLNTIQERKGKKKKKKKNIGCWETEK